MRASTALRKTRSIASLPWVAMAFAAALAVIAGWPTRFGAFLAGDDRNLVLDHVLINHPTWAHAWRLLWMVHGDLYQPIPMLSLQLNFALFGAEAYGYHLTNIALHAVNAGLATALAFALSRDRRAAAIAGMLFACHPLAIEPVAWVTGRMILFAALFGLTTLNVFAYRGPQATPRFAIAAVVCWLLALVSKVLPSVPLAAAWVDASVHGREPGPWGRSRRWWAAFGAMLALTAVFTLWAIRTTKETKVIDIINAEIRTPAAVRMVLAARYYLEGYIRPTRLCAWSPPPRDLPAASAPVAIAVVELAALTCVAVLLRRRCRPAWDGLLLFAILLAPFIAAVKARNFLTADRYMYLPMVGLNVAVGAMLVAAADGLSARFGRRALRLAPIGAAVMLAIPLLMQGRVLADAWRDNVAQARRVVSLHRDDVRAWVELAKAQLFEGRPREALETVRTARTRWPDEPSLASEAGEAQWQLGAWTEAVRELSAAAGRLPISHRCHYYLGLALEKLDRSREARAKFAAILADRENMVPAATALARNFRDAGELEESLRWYDHAVRMNPHHRNALFESAELRMRLGRYEEASAALQRILSFLPEDQPARLNLGVCLLRLGDPQAALRAYDELLASGATSPVVRVNRAEVLAALGRARDAEAEYRRAMGDDPRMRAALVGLSLLLQSQHRYADMAAAWQEFGPRTVGAEESGAWVDWSRRLEGRAIFAAPASRPSAAPAGAARYLRSFAGAWALRTPDELRGLTELPGATNDADRDALRAVIAALTDLGVSAPQDPPLLYKTAAALGLRGDFELARRFAERLRAVDDPGWAGTAAELKRWIAERGGG